MSREAAWDYGHGLRLLLSLASFASCQGLSGAEARIVGRAGA